MKFYQDIKCFVCIGCIFIFMLSSLSWIIFFANTFDYFFLKDKNDSLQVEYSVENNNNTQLNESSGKFISKYCKRVDSILTLFENKWYKSIFQRKRLSVIDSQITYFVTGDIISSQVLKGDKGWLFYKTTTDGNPIDDYLGKNMVGDLELQSLVNSAKRVEKELLAKGIRFQIVIIPNKEQVYSEFMPSIYSHAELSSADRILDAFQSNGVTSANPKKAMLLTSSKSDVFYKYDTHWNLLGAYIGVKSVVKQWGIEVSDLCDRSINIDYLNNISNVEVSDDLARLCGLENYFEDEIYYTIEGQPYTDWRLFDTEQKEGKVSCFTNENALIDSSILVVGDSFRVAMVPSLSEVFKDVYIVNRKDYTVELIDEISPDFFLAEYVERYADQLKYIEFILGN